MPLLPFSSSCHPWSTWIVLFHICTCLCEKMFSVSSNKPITHPFDSFLILCSTVLYINTFKFSFCFCPSFIFLLSFLTFSLLLSFSLAVCCSHFPLSLFPAFICSVSAPQSGCYVTVMWCVGPLKAYRPDRYCSSLLDSASSVSDCVHKQRFATFKSKASFNL